MSSTTDLDTLVINYLTQAQYESAKSGGTIDPDQIYLTPAQGTGVTDVEVDGSSVVTGGVAEVDLSGKADVSHTHTKSQITDFPTIPTITDTYSSTSSNGMSGKAVNSALQTLDGTVSGTAGSGKTLTAFSQTDGKVSATFGNISITKSQISDFPAIPTITDTYSGTSSDGMSGKAVKSAIDALDGTISGSAGAGKTLTAFSQTDGKVSATFSNISITKSQVSDFPTIPTVNNATLTIQKNGTTVNTFTANASSNVTANITVPTDTGDLTNGAGYITGYTETDPTVPSWAKASSKPTYTYSEVGAAASSHAHGNITSGGDITTTATIANGDRIVINDESASKVTNSSVTFGTSTSKYLANNGTWQDVPTVPTNVSAFTNDAGYLTSYTETDPTVPSWAKASSKPSYTFSEIGSKPSTISGYGITDAKIETGTITLGSNTITPLTSFTETDPIFTASDAYGIDSTDIANWDNSYDGKISLDTSAQAGTTDGDLYSAIVALGWASDVIE